MKLSKRLRKWKANLTTQTPIDYVITLRADVNGFADEVKALEGENAKLRELLNDAAIELYVNGNVTDGATELLFDQMRELGIEVGE